MATRSLVLNQINLVVHDIKASEAFYRLLGANFPTTAERESSTPYHASCKFANDFDFDLDAPRFAEIWNKGWAGRTDLAGRAVLGSAVQTRGDVDGIYSEMTAAGYRGLQPPFDAFWGSRYAILEDPDGAAVGIMRPSEPSRRFWPPPGWEE